ncbi:MAG: hypothetical protein M0R17_11020 [Candidatus Omnitrophica bacterium]|jgi:hypothetical protein|nr:hypothetical protein [Candidatus Omnitrophota bacterium]
MKKDNKNLGTCVWIGSVGEIKLRIFTIVKEDQDKTTISFENNEQLIIPRKFIRAKRVMIFKTSEGKIIVQNPDNWKRINLKEYNIKELRFNLQNFSLQEGKAAIHRWTTPKDAISKLSPLFKLLMICIVVGVIGWAALKFGTYVLDIVMKSRLLDCSQIIPRVQIPIGTNISVPVGV